MNNPPPLRKGVGFIFVALGVLHVFSAALAAWFLRGLPLASRAVILAFFYYAHFLLLTGGTCAYLFFGYWRARAFYIEPFLDFLAGLGLFVFAVGVAGALIARVHFGETLFLIPGTFLIVYGAGLIQGRPFGFGPRG
ncbi:MAG TPA: hypothetical protein VNH15_08215 [Elusimicrobiota bacterium]|nr:hypothetical protein [Elusimicrobiota bacterium]